MKISKRLSPSYEYVLANTYSPPNTDDIGECSFNDIFSPDGLSPHDDELDNAPTLHQLSVADTIGKAIARQHVRITDDAKLALTGKGKQKAIDFIDKIH